MTNGIAIRTSLGPTTGIGHYMRMHRLALELSSRGIPVKVWIDDLASLQGVPCEIPVSALYEGDEGFCVTADAKKMLHVLKERPFKLIIVDDYRIDSSWEQDIRSAGHKVIAIDDLCRPHCCDMLIDMKWRGEPTATAYDGLISPSAIRLLGPAYTLLDSGHFAEAPRTNNDFTVTLSVGGGGDGALLAAITEGIITSDEYIEKPVTLQAVVGPQMYNREALHAAAGMYPALRLVTDATSLQEVFSRTHLYIGAIGGTIYELLALQIPALTFAMASNQGTDTALLRDIGHHFHIPDYVPEDRENLISLFWTIVAQYDRAAALCRNPRVPVDGEGCRRVADAVEALLAGSAQPPAAVYPAPALEDEEGEPLGGDYRIRSVHDHDMGRYLESRNLPANRQNMLQQSGIREISHYRWWFHTERSSFLLSKKGVPLLYIWHEKVFIDRIPYLVGGWFVCTGECRFNDAMIALSWQLEHCDDLEPGVPWIAAIKRQNHFVRTMNQYMGFRDVTDRNSLIYRAINSYFKGASEDEFFFVCR